MDKSDDPLKCLAFSAVTVCRGLELQKMAKSEPDRLASEVLELDEISVQRMLPAELVPNYNS